MPKSLVFTLFLLTAIFTACQPDTAVEAQEDEQRPDSLSFSTEFIERQLPCRDSSIEEAYCLSVEIERIEVKNGGTSDGRQSINKKLNSFYSATDHAESTASTPNEMADQMVAEYQRIMQEMPDYRIPWEYRTDSEVYLNQLGLFGVKLDVFSYTGGAHPSNMVFYFLFDANSGNTLEWADLFKKGAADSLRHRAERQFLSNNNIDTASGYEEAGYWFEENRFALPSNFRYQQDGLLFTYNVYEIAPYSEGRLNLQFTYAEIRDLLKPEYRF